jgi:uncharacterized membrane protein (UPF0127 family)
MKKLIILPALFLFFACQTESEKKSDHTQMDRSVTLETPSGESIRTILAIEPQEQERGLSGVRSENFSEDEAMMFFDLEDNERHFWMPDTYFDLDLFYLDKDLKILEVVRQLPHHIGRSNPHLIPRAPRVWARHVLEMKATSEISKKLKVGDSLVWKDSLTLKETEERIKKSLQKTK